ncbi:MAG: bacteriohemerythrin [Rhodoferax sp.]
MQLMAWSEHFVTGIESVDAQHQALVNMINVAAPHLASGGEEARQAVGPLLDKLINYAATHFKFEESLMQQVHVDPGYYGQHFKTHETFVDEVLQMRQQYEKGEELGGRDLLNFLTSWLTFHILSEDKRMARQVLAIRAGRSPEQAYTELDAPEGAPQAVYTAALIDLFGLLTTRNRTLTQVNEQVRTAKVELEARVEARTHELAAANAELQTERKALVETIGRLEQAQEQLLQSEKMAAVGQLAAGVAHEINNPVGFVSSNIGSLSGYVAQMFELIAAYEKACTGMPAALRAPLDAVRDKVEIDYLRQDVPDLLRETKEGLVRVKRIVNDLRDFSHVDTARWEPADINQTLESALNVAWNEVKYKADVVKELAPLPPVTCNSTQVSQVFVNLLVNAAQSIQGHGKITLRTGVSDAAVWIEISDTGCGMPEEVQRRIFEPFYTTKPVGKGTGLGLSISWEIVKRHDGTIHVCSLLGEGTTFRITLPLVHAARNDS